MMLKRLNYQFFLLEINRRQKLFELLVAVLIMLHKLREKYPYDCNSMYYFSNNQKKII